MVRSRFFPVVLLSTPSQVGRQVVSLIYQALYYRAVAVCDFYVGWFYPCVDEGSVAVFGLVVAFDYRAVRRDFDRVFSSFCVFQGVAEAGRYPAAVAFAYVFGPPFFGGHAGWIVAGEYGGDVYIDRALQRQAFAGHFWVLFAYGCVAWYHACFHVTRVGFERARVQAVSA